MLILFWLECKWHNHLGEKAFSYSVKPADVLQPSTSTPKHLPKRKTPYCHSEIGI